MTVIPFQISRDPAFVSMRKFLRRIKGPSVGEVQMPDGEKFIVLRPAQWEEIQAIVQDPAFVAALEAGASDIAKGNIVDLHKDPVLLGTLLDAMPVSQEMAASIEAGVADIRQGRVSHSEPGETLAAFAKRLARKPKAASPGKSERRSAAVHRASAPSRRKPAAKRERR